MRYLCLTWFFFVDLLKETERKWMTWLHHTSDAACTYTCAHTMYTVSEFVINLWYYYNCYIQTMIKRSSYQWLINIRIIVKYITLWHHNNYRLHVGSKCFVPAYCRWQCFVPNEVETSIWFLYNVAFALSFGICTE